MILNCPNCSMRYLLNASALGPNGRRVRCASCDHEWFQEPEETDFAGTLAEALGQDPDEEEVFEAPAEQDLDPIPDSVKPIPEGSAVPALPEDGPTKLERMLPNIVGFMAAAAVFFVLLAGLFSVKNMMVSKWPALAGLYQMLGADVYVTGEELVFDQVKADIRQDEQGIDVVHVSGTILNLKSKTLEVPLIQASLRQDDGLDIAHWKIEPAANSLTSEGELLFEATHPLPKDGTVTSVNVTFVPFSSSEEKQHSDHDDSAHKSKDHDSSDEGNH